MNNLTLGSCVAALILAAIGAIGAGIGRIVWNFIFKNVSRVRPPAFDWKNIRGLWIGASILVIGFLSWLAFTIRASPDMQAETIGFLAAHSGAVLASAGLLVAAAVLVVFGKGVGRLGAVACVLAIAYVDYRAYPFLDRNNETAPARATSLLSWPPQLADVPKPVVTDDPQSAPYQAPQDHQDPQDPQAPQDHEIRIDADLKGVKLIRGAVYHLVSVEKKQSIVTVVSGKASGWPSSDVLPYCNQTPAELTSGEATFGVRWVRACSDDTIVDISADRSP